MVQLRNTDDVSVSPSLKSHPRPTQLWHTYAMFRTVSFVRVCARACVCTRATRIMHLCMLMRYLQLDISNWNHAYMLKHCWRVIGHEPSLNLPIPVWMIYYAQCISIYIDIYIHACIHTYIWMNINDTALARHKPPLNLPVPAQRRLYENKKNVP